MYFVAIKMGRRQGARSGASRTTFDTPGTLGLEGSMKVVRDVTDEQRGRRPIFIATLRAASFARKGLNATRLQGKQGQISELPAENGRTIRRNARDFRNCSALWAGP